MTRYSDMNIRWFVAILALSVCTTDVAVGAEKESQDDEGIDGIAALAEIAREDPDRLHETLHGARILAESGAGYEAARVVAGIAYHAGESDPGREAKEWLEMLGLSIEEIRAGSPVDISAEVARKIHHGDGDHRGEARVVHVRNLVELGLFREAADALLASSERKHQAGLEGQWSELLSSYRIPAELLTSRSESSIDRVIEVLKESYRRNQLRYRVHSLWSVDHEAAEVGQALLEHLDVGEDRVSHEEDEGEWQEEEDHYGRWVADRPDDDEQNSEAEEREADEHSIEELAPLAFQRALRLAKGNPESAKLLATLIVETAPESLAADSARALIQRLVIKPQPSVGNESRNGPEDPGAEMFRTPQVRDYRLSLSDAAIEQLHENPKQYVRAAFHEGDEVYRDVGVRLKGGWGSFRMIDGRSKAGFTVKFNQFNKKQRFHGVRRIVLNNGAQDPSFLHEYVGYQLFRSAGVPAPRIAFANVTVNDESYGFYVQVEAVTKDFLALWFEKTNGNLYEGPGDVMQWRELDLDSNQEKEDRHDLRRLAKAVEAAGEEDPWATLADYVDVDSFARFLAMEQLVNHWDGYTQCNNYRMYQDPGTKTFYFFPHGCDQLFEDLGHNVFYGQAGILSRALLQTESGKKRYTETMRKLLDQVWNEESIRKHIADAYSVIWPHVASNRGKSRHSLSEFEHHVSRMLEFVSIRRYVVQTQLRRSQTKSSWRERQDDDEGIPSFLHRDGNW